MPIFKKDNNIVLFRHIPKTGGTSIEEAFKAGNWSMTYFNASPSKPCCPQHYHNELIDYYNIIAQEQPQFQFAFVRNPWHRLISEFYHQNKSQRNSLKKTGLVDQHGVINFLKTNAPKYFEQEQLFLSNKESFCKNNKFIFDNHMRPQFHFISANTAILRFERLLAEWKRLQTRFGLPDLPEKNIGGGHHKYPDRCDIDDKQFKQLYLELYSKDHTQFNYPLPF